MRFNLYIDVENDAFQPKPYAETARILRAIADRLDHTKPDPRGREFLDDYADSKGGWTGHYQTILDSNGNDVGRYAFKSEETR